MNELWSTGYVEQHKSRVIKGKMFIYKTCDFRGLAPDVTRELLNEYID